VSFSWKRQSTNRSLRRSLDRLKDEQVSVIVTGDCWDLSYVCICRSYERFALCRSGVVDVHGRLTTLGLRMQQELFGD
jgi:hypothetical protein